MARLGARIESWCSLFVVFVCAMFCLFFFVCLGCSGVFCLVCL